jgi:methionyl-tRNA formyltransferase
MRIIFAGTPDFAAESLKALLQTEHTVCAVYTQPDRPAGRGRKLTPSPVKQIALEHAIPVEQPLNFKSEDSLAQLKSYQADLMVVVAYGLLLPQAVLDTPRLGCINVHASLLPRWRGAAPIQRAILAGDTETGVGIMKMEAGLDTGPVLLEARCPIRNDDTAQLLHDRLAQLGAESLVTSLTGIEDRLAQAKPQDEANKTYARKLEKQEALVDWQHSAEQILRQVNAFNPWPVAQTQWHGDTMRIWLAQLADTTQHGEPGEVLAVSQAGIDIACGEGALRITQLQIPGKRAMAVRDFLNANQLKVGEQLG